MKYIVICREEVFFNSKNIKRCREFITKTLNKYPGHSEMKIYKEVKDENKKK